MVHSISGSSDPLYNKLSFTGYRVFFLQPSNTLPDRPGVLCYVDIDLSLYNDMASALGHYPGPHEFAEVYAGYRSRVDRIEYRAAFVNNERYERLWTAEWYERQQLERRSLGQ